MTRPRRFVVPIDPHEATDPRTALARTRSGLQTLTKAEHDALDLQRPATDGPMRTSGLPTIEEHVSIIDQYTGHLRSEP